MKLNLKLLTLVGLICLCSCSKVVELSEDLGGKRAKKKAAEKIKNLAIHDQIFAKLGNIKASNKITSQGSIVLKTAGDQIELEEKSSVLFGKNGVEIKTETLPSNSITYLKIGNRYFQKSQSGSYFESKKLKDDFENLERDALHLPKHYLEFFKNRIKFEKRADLIVDNIRREVYQILLVKSENKLERNGMVRPKNIDLSKLGNLKDKGDFKLFKKFGQALSGNGQIQIDKKSGDIKFLDFMGALIVSLDNKIQQADFKFKTQVKENKMPNIFKIPKIISESIKREKHPEDYKKLL